MTCPICQKRKAKRYCPAKTQSICSVCCGTEREVAIDCPSDCPHLVASRQYDYERKEIDWTKMPFADTKIPASFVADHNPLVGALAYAICLYAKENRELVDSDLLASLGALAETYQTLARGIYYEKAPDYRPQREVYDRLKAAIEEHRKVESRRAGLGGARDADVSNALVFLAQLGFARTNERPKGRAFLDLLRSQFRSSEELSRPASDILLLP
jgi:hypothetical protein